MVRSEPEDRSTPPFGNIPVRTWTVSIGLLHLFKPPTRDHYIPKIPVLARILLQTGLPPWTFCTHLRHGSLRRHYFVPPGDLAPGVKGSFPTPPGLIPQKRPVLTTLTMPIIWERFQIYPDSRTKMWEGMKQLSRPAIGTNSRHCFTGEDQQIMAWPGTFTHHPATPST